MDHLTMTWQSKVARKVLVKKAELVQEEEKECQRQRPIIICSAFNKDRVMQLLARRRALPQTTVMVKLCRSKFRKNLAVERKMPLKKI